MFFLVGRLFIIYLFISQFIRTTFRVAAHGEVNRPLRGDIIRATANYSGQGNTGLPLYGSLSARAEKSLFQDQNYFSVHSGY